MISAAPEAGRLRARNFTSDTAEAWRSERSSVAAYLATPSLRRGGTNPATSPRSPMNDIHSNIRTATTTISGPKPPGVIHPLTARAASRTRPPVHEITHRLRVAAISEADKESTIDAVRWHRYAGARSIANRPRTARPPGEPQCVVLRALMQRNIQSLPSLTVRSSATAGEPTAGIGPRAEQRHQPSIRPPTRQHQRRGPAEIRNERGEISTDIYIAPRHRDSAQTPTRTAQINGPGRGTASSTHTNRIPAKSQCPDKRAPIGGATSSPETPQSIDDWRQVGASSGLLPTTRRRFRRPALALGGKAVCSSPLSKSSASPSTSAVQEPGHDASVSSNGQMALVHRGAAARFQAGSNVWQPNAEPRPATTSNPTPRRSTILGREVGDKRRPRYALAIARLIGSPSFDAGLKKTVPAFGRGGTPPEGSARGADVRKALHTEK